MELLPCPFCGAQIDGVSCTIHVGFEHYPNHSVECNRCRGRTGFHWTSAEAITAWNARTPVHESAAPTGVCPKEVS